MKNPLAIQSKSTRFIFIIICSLIFFRSNAQGVDNILTIPESNRPDPFVGSGNFNAIIFGNHDANSADTEGRLAVGGNFTFSPPLPSSYSVGLSAGTIGSPNAPDNTDNLIVNLNFANNGNAGWVVQGNFVSNTVSGSAVIPSGTTTTGVSDHIIFSDNTLLNYYRNISDALNGVSNNADVAYSEFSSPITITGTSNTLNVADVTVPDNLVTTGFDIQSPEGSTTIVNILNSTITISGGNMLINGVGISGYTGWDSGGKVLFNFPNATSITFESFSLLGSLLAPYSDMTASGGSVNGQSVIGGNFTQLQGFEFHNFDFTGEIDETTLPVNLIDFKVSVNENHVNINWKTASEVNSNYFDIQRSHDAEEWESIGRKPANNVSYETSEYYFTDVEPRNGSNYYRLKMVDSDDTYIYSDIQTIVFRRESFKVVGYPNPVSTGKLNICSDDWSSVKDIQLLNMMGQNVNRQNLVNVPEINLSGLTKGIYFLKSTNFRGVSNVQRIVVE